MSDPQESFHQARTGLDAVIRAVSAAPPTPSGDSANRAAAEQRSRHTPAAWHPRQPQAPIRTPRGHRAGIAAAPQNMRATQSLPAGTAGDGQQPAPPDPVAPPRLAGPKRRRRNRHQTKSKSTMPSMAAPELRDALAERAVRRSRELTRPQKPDISNSKTRLNSQAPGGARLQARTRRSKRGRDVSPITIKQVNSRRTSLPRASISLRLCASARRTPSTKPRGPRCEARRSRQPRASTPSPPGWRR